MAFNRRSGQRFTANVWPGFVDAMTALLLVLMFVLSIFMIVQFVLSETISDQDLELDALGEQVASLADALGLETARAAQLQDDVAALGAERDEQSALIATLNAQRDDLTARVTSFEEQVASLLATRDRLSASLQRAETERDTLAANLEEAEGERSNLAAQLETTQGELTRIIDEREALQLALATARDEVDAQAEAARLAAAQKEAVDALLADLRAEAEAQNATLAQTLAALEGQQTRAADLEAQAETLQGDLDAAESARLAELAAAEALRTRLAETEATLSAEEEQRLADAAAAEALRERLLNSDAELTAMTLALEEQRREAEETLTLLAATESARDDLTARLAQALTDLDEVSSTGGTAAEQLAEALAALEEKSESETDLRDQLAAALAAKLAAENIGRTVLTQSEETNLLLGQARTELAEIEESRLAAQREAALLNQQVVELRQQLTGLQNLLDAAADRDNEAQVQLDALGNRLNAALAQVASEQRARAELEEAERRRLEEEAKQLERFRSEFFGQLRDVLDDREGVQIVGDRFVFSSEVLFAAGSADLQFEGRSQIAQVAEVILDVADEIPSEIEWVLRVDGHTDNIPLSGLGEYANNWELSQARALSVVLFMINALGVPPERLAATGFGEFQPVDAADSDDARQRNRRIELKLTER